MDDTAASSTPGTDTNFTPNETKLICAIMQNLTSEIQFDADKVALSLGYKNGGSLRARWNSLKRTKISGAVDAAPTGGVSKATPSKKAKATPKKAKAAAGAEEDDDSPSLGGGGKKTGKGGKAKPKVKTDEGEEEEVVDSVEGPKGVALGGDFFTES